MNIAVIPARGGSKRIPQKNTREFCGKPILAYSVEAAINAEIFDRIVVSTDDEEIAAKARYFGAEVPFLRPIELADDYTPTVPVVRHALQQLQLARESHIMVCCIYPTAPFVELSDLRATREALIKEPEAEFSIPVTTFDYPIFRSLRLENQYVSMIFPEYQETRSQDLPKAWHDAGLFYWGRMEAWLRCENIFKSRTVAVPVPRSRVQDIDTLEDWQIAERIFQAWRHDT